MWKDYFYQIQLKYSMRLSKKSPLVIRLDGKDITKDTSINFLERFTGSFSDNLEKTVAYFTRKYQCFSIFGSDEVSFIFPNPMLLMEDLSSDNSNRANEVISLFSQYFYDYFNHFDAHRKVFWHAKCFSIPEDKTVSYVKYRSGSIKNVMITYFLKKKEIRMGNIPLAEKIKKAKSFFDYPILEELQNGILYAEGEKMQLATFLEEGKWIPEEEIGKIEVDISNLSE